MAYDLLVKNGRIIDGSGRPAFHGDVGIARGKIVEMGRLDGPAKRTIEADGRVVAPGFVDNHCHYDAQVLWDPLCTFSCHHGATTVIIGNCSLALAPVKAEEREKLAGMLSYVEAIPMDVLEAGVPWNWETFPEYMRAIGQRLGVNVGTLIGHSAVRLYAMGKDASERDATEAELAVMRRLVREAIDAGALGLSITRNMNHFDISGQRIPAACAPESELFALADVLREAGTGVIQCGGGTNPEMKDRLLSRISQACGRPIMYNTLLEQARQPGRWKKHLAHVEEVVREGLRAIPLCNPGSIVNRFTMKNCQVFRSMPTWLPILQGPDEQKLIAYRDPATRDKLRAEVEAPLNPDLTFSKRWDMMTVEETKLAKNHGLRGRHLADIGEQQGKHPVDVLLDLALEENLETVFSLGEINMDTEAVAQILSSPVRGRRPVRRRCARAVPLERVEPDAAARLLGAREEDHVARARRPAAHVRLGDRVRHLRPRAAPARHGRRRRRLRSRDRSPGHGRRRARLPQRRVADARAGRGHPLHRGERRGLAGEGHAHGQPPGPRADERATQRLKPLLTP